MGNHQSNPKKMIFSSKDQKYIVSQIKPKCQNNIKDYIVLIRKLQISNQTKNQTQIYGTGFLISPNLVLTCAHNLYNRDQKENSNSRQQQIYCYVGMTNTQPMNNSRAYKSCFYRFPEQYTKQIPTKGSVLTESFLIRHQEDYKKQYISLYDYALLLLEQDVKKVDKFVKIVPDYVDANRYQTGIMISHNQNKLKKGVIQQVYQKGEIQSFDQKYINHHIPTKKGDSGSPILAHHNPSSTSITSFHLLGIHIQDVSPVTISKYHMNQSKKSSVLSNTLSERSFKRGLVISGELLMGIVGMEKELIPGKQSKISGMREIRVQVGGAKNQQEVGKQIQKLKGCQDLQSMLQLTRWHYYLGNYKTCQQLFYQILEKTPKQRIKYADLINELAISLMKSKNYSQAQYKFRQALDYYQYYEAANYKSKIVKNNLAMVLFQQNKEDKKMEALEIMIQLVDWLQQFGESQGRYEVNNNLGYMAYLQNCYQESITKYSHSLKNNPLPTPLSHLTTPQNHHNLALSNFHLNPLQAIYNCMCCMQWYKKLDLIKHPDCMQFKKIHLYEIGKLYQKIQNGEVNDQGILEGLVVVVVQALKRYYQCGGLIQKFRKFY